MPITRHVAYVPRAEYEKLEWSRERRFPVCTRSITTGQIIFPPGFTPPEGFLRELLAKPMNVMLPQFTIN